MSLSLLLRNDAVGLIQGVVNRRKIILVIFDDLDDIMRRMLPKLLPELTVHEYLGLTYYVRRIGGCPERQLYALSGQAS